ncbi:MAG: ATP-binding cassette domain-containing protein [Flavobacteriales bacterium]|nr:ATP-binding cassette domain-containing protein [Flavobacteriales bacterium]
MLEVVEIEKRFQNHVALDKISLLVPTNSIYGLLGPNGAGKTTLLRIINQIVSQDSGKILLDGEELQSHHISHIGYMPEERGLYKSMKIGDQAMYLAQLKGLSKYDAKRQIEYWFKKFEIEEWWNKRIEELSKGMAQKIQFIVTVLHQPKLLIFDEPFSGFDPVNADLIKEEIMNLRANGATIIFSTHRMESVEEMCDHIALLNKANKVLEGNLTQIKRKYRTNTFEVGLFPNDKSVLSQLGAKWKVSEDSFSSIDDILQFKVEIPTDVASTDLLNDIMPHGNVVHFSEKIPSVNDIFINAVKSVKE